MTNEFRLSEAIEDIRSQYTTHGYVAYIMYAIATWLSGYCKFNFEEIDTEFDTRVMPYVDEFINSDYDNPCRPLIDCINEFMNAKANSNEIIFINQK